MTSPKTVTSDQPQAVPDAVHELTQECRYCANTGWFYGDPDLKTYCGCQFGKVREDASALAARPVLPVETPAEGLREAVTAIAARYEQYDTPNIRSNSDYAEAYVLAAKALRAALAAAPPETAEMEGEEEQEGNDILLAQLRYVMKSNAVNFDRAAKAEQEREEWKAKAERAAEDERDRLYAIALKSPGSVAIVTPGFLKDEGGAMLPADRLAARASSSGEAGDE